MTDKLKCSHCYKTKDPSEFYKRGDTARGYQYTCKECRNALRKARVQLRLLGKLPKHSDIETKICAKCHTKKLVSDFYKHIGTADGYQSYCKLCHNELVRSCWRSKRK